MYINTSGFRIAIPAGAAEYVENQLGKEVIFGIRPEDIHAAKYVPTEVVGEKVKAQVEVQELMGNEIFLYMDAHGKSFIARVDPRARARTGQSVDVIFNMANMHLFDPKTELSLLR
ncbi:MAG: TOBE domain-containing protein, partial [Ardenticatenaceae bacterium]